MTDILVSVCVIPTFNCVQTVSGSVSGKTLPCFPHFDVGCQSCYAAHCHVTSWLLKTSLLKSVLYTFVYCIHKVKTLNIFANFFPQSTDMQTIMHFQLMHFIS